MKSCTGLPLSYFELLLKLLLRVSIMCMYIYIDVCVAKYIIFDSVSYVMLLFLKIFFVDAIRIVSVRGKCI